MDNKELIQEVAKGMPEAQALGKNSHIMYDVKTQEFSNAIRSPVTEFASNEVFRPLETEVAWAYKDPDNIYIADTVAPRFPVKQTAGEYRKFNDRTFYDPPKTITGSETPPNKVTWGSSILTYTLYGRALAAYLSNLDKANAVSQYGSVNKWREIVTKLLTRMLLLDREITVKTLYQTSGNYAAGYSVSASPVWSNATATINADVITGEDALLTPRDMIVLSHDVYRVLQTHSAVTGSTTVSGGKRQVLEQYVNQEVIENFFDSPIVIGSARYNSAPESATPTFSRIWQNYVTVCHLAPNPGGQDLSAPFVRTFVLDSAEFPNREGWAVKSVLETGTFAGGEILMVGYFAEEKIFAQKSGYLIKAL